MFTYTIILNGIVDTRVYLWGLVIIQAFVIEFVTFEIDFITFAVELIAFAIEFVTLAIELGMFALEFIHNEIGSYRKHKKTKM